MKHLIIALSMLVGFSAQAEDVPAYMKDAEIIVKTKDGKEYKFSGNEYKVVKRGSSTTTIPFIVSTPKLVPVQSSNEEKVSRHKHIISLEVVRSQHGFDYEVTGSTHTVSTKYETGVGLMYQNNFHKDWYLGGRLDTNSGGALNIGHGF